MTNTEIETLYHEGESTPINDTTTTWKLQLKSSISSYSDNENYLGISDAATDAQDAAFDTAEPPASPGSYISLYFPHPEWASPVGNNFAKDIKKNSSLADTVKRWIFQVTSNVTNDSVTLSFVNDRIPAAFGKYLTDLKTGKRFNLKNISSYKYYNTSDTARSFLLIIGDSTAPLLSLTMPNGSNIWRSNTVKNVAWNSADGTGIDSTFIYFSSNSGTSYELAASVGAVRNWNWTVPKEYLNHNYSVKIFARDSVGNQSSVKSAKTFTVAGDSLSNTNQPGWSLISLPLIPADSSALSIFGNTSYLWGYSQVSGYTQPQKVSVGTGYWLGLLVQKAWFVKGAANESDSSQQDLTIGYNIIGSNFVRNVSKENLIFTKSGMRYTFAGAVTAGLISNVLYKYNTAGYANADTMSLFNGYWIAALQSGVQMIEKPNVSVTAPLNKAEQVFAANWDLSIKASSGSMTDEIYTIGMKPLSTRGFDNQYDAPRPPRNPGSNYLEIYTLNTGGNYPSILGDKYARDYRDSASASWSFTVESGQTGSVTLAWDRTILEQLAGKVKAVLTDNGNGQVIDMRTSGTYTFAYAAPRIFSINTVLTGVSRNGEPLPSDFTLLQNFPNPFNPSTTIQFSLPQSASVSLKIYDMTGREVAELVNRELAPGYYSSRFNAEGLASGLYLYRLTAISAEVGKKSFFTDSKKLLLVR